MIPVMEADFDRYLLRIEKELDKEERLIKEKEKTDLGLGFSIDVPKGFAPAREHSADIYWSINRPLAVWIRDGGRVGFSFQRVEGGRPEGLVKSGLLSFSKEIRRMLEQADGRTVFYGEGITPKGIGWLEYKRFAEEKRVYQLLCFFQAGGGDVLGSFYCSYEEYEKWRKVFFGMMQTVEMQEGGEG